MSFRNRPVLDRKHRPRWQDELRTQQLLVAGFALAIAVAVGIFGAAAWSSFYQSNLRQAALVDGTAVRRAEVVQRIQIVAAELQAITIDLQAHAGGARDQAVQQQLSSLEAALGSVQQAGSESLVTGLLLDKRASEFGGQPTADEIQAELDERRTQPARAQLSLILMTPEKDEGADELTDADWAEAKAEIEGIKAELDGGAEFGTLAAERSADASAAQNGLLGWIESSDPQYGHYFDAIDGAEVGNIVGPLKSDAGWYLLRVEDREEAGRDEILDQFLSGAGITEEMYRDYVRQELLQERAQDYFTNTVQRPYQPQRKVAQIVINNETGFPVPKVRIRHLLVQPLPGAEDQSTATDKQWATARRTAQELRTEAEKRADEDWFNLAEQSDDSGSASRGGYLGWYDPQNLAGQFVPEFAEAAGRLEIGEISGPVRSQFGYHIIQVTQERVSPGGQAETLVAELRDEPSSFADVARLQSEDVSTAKKGGEVGWVIRYQFETERDRAIFDLAEPGDISEPVVSSSGIHIYKLLDTAELRFVPKERREGLGSAGFTRWLNELKVQAGVWVDAEFAPSTDTPA
jgi:parvulin-like peptidyl-prolyl isomerase